MCFLKDCNETRPILWVVGVTGTNGDGNQLYRRQTTLLIVSFSLKEVKTISFRRKLQAKLTNIISTEVCD